MSNSTKIVVATLVTITVLLNVVAYVVHNALAYELAHPQTCINGARLVNMVGRADRTLTFNNGQVLQERQLQHNEPLEMGKVYCTAWARK